MYKRSNPNDGHGEKQESMTIHHKWVEYDATIDEMELMINGRFHCASLISQKVSQAKGWSYTHRKQKPIKNFENVLITSVK